MDLRAAPWPQVPPVTGRDVSTRPHQGGQAGGRGCPMRLASPCSGHSEQLPKASWRLWVARQAPAFSWILHIQPPLFSSCDGAWAARDLLPWRTVTSSVRSGTWSPRWGLWLSASCVCSATFVALWTPTATVLS